MINNTQKARDYIDCYFEKMSEFGFELSESTIFLLNANNLDLDKILKVINYIEIPGTGVPRDVSKSIAAKQIKELLK